MKLQDSEIQKDRQQEAMKTALMRGVCALNMEAMAAFKDNVGVRARQPSPEVQIPLEESISQSLPLFDALLVPKSSTPYATQPKKQSEVKSVKFADKKPDRILITRHQ